MIAECNSNVQEMLAAIGPLFLACMTDDVPPPVLSLEHIEDADIATCNLIVALTLFEDLV